MRSDIKKLGRKFFFPLLLAGLAMNLGGCVSMQLTNAQFWADEAAEIAADCPAGREAAQAAAQAAESARTADQEYQQASQRETSLRQELAVAQADADYYNRRADGFQASIDAYQEDTREQESYLRDQIGSCQNEADAMYEEENDWLPDMMIEFYDCNSGCDNSSCMRSHVRNLRDQLAHMSAVRRGAEEAERFRDSARAEAQAKTARLAEVTRMVETEANKATAASSELRAAEEEAHRQMENAAALCDDDLLTEPSSPPPAPTGQYDQDVYNAQSQGLPGAVAAPAPAPAPAPPPPPPPPAGTCDPGSPIFTTCSVNAYDCSLCTGGCSVGQEAICDSCRAAGCF